MKLKRKIDNRPLPIATSEAVIPSEVRATPHNIEEYLQPNDWNSLKNFENDQYQYNIDYGMERFVVADDISALADRSMLFPDRTSEITISDGYFQDCLNNLSYLRNNGDWHAFFNLAYGLLLLCPEKKERFGLDEEAFEKGKKNNFSRKQKRLLD